MAKSKVKSNKVQPQRKNSFPHLYLIVFILIVSAVAVFFFFRTQGGVNKHFPNWVSLESRAFSQEMQEKMIFALAEFDAKYSCGRNIVIREKTGLDHAAAAAEPGIIYFDPKLLIIDDVRDDTYHEAFHACKPDRVLLKQPIPYLEDQIIAYEGLTVVILDKNKKDEEEKEIIGGFGDIEEAVVEALSYKSFPGYDAEETGYTDIMNLVLSKLNMSLPQMRDLLTRTDDSGMKEFLADYLDKPIETITINDFNTVGYQLHQVMEAEKKREKPADSAQ